jgi:cyclohexanecarboxyl-CoA dehydrogenase
VSLNRPLAPFTTDAHEDLRKVVASVAATLAGGSRKRDADGVFPYDVMAQLSAAGLMGLDLPEEFGGQGAGSVASGLAIAGIAEADFVAAQILIQTSTATRLLAQFADPQIRDTWIPRLLDGRTQISLALTEPTAGSDLAGVRLRAEPDGDGWVLSGEKSSVSFPGSEALIVLARTDDGLQLFFVDDKTNITRSPLNDLGNRAAGRDIMFFDKVPVAANGRIGGPAGGFRTILESLTSARLLVAMSCVGVAKAAWHDMVDWANTRETFGAPLSQKQGIAFPAVDHAIAIELAELLAVKGLWLEDAGLPFEIEAAMAKAWVPRRMFDVCHDALLMHGHVGYTDEHPAQQRLRDILAADIGEGMANVQRIILARKLIGSNPL